MRKPVSAGVYLEILLYVVQQKTIRVPGIQKKFGLSYNRTIMVMDLLEKYGVVSAANPNGRKVTAPYNGSNQVHLLLPLDDINSNINSN